jgi:GNAT superfamily N-acetyltransferase
MRHVLGLFARDTKAPLSLRELAFGTFEYETSVGLRYAVLRAPLGLKLGPDERREEAALIHLGAFEGERLVGCLMLHDQRDGRVRMRQVAIAEDRQRTGIGQRLVAFSEERARELGFREMILHARETAVLFYEKLGYQSFDEPFEEVTIPHRKMRKALHPPG